MNSYFKFISLIALMLLYGCAAQVLTTNPRSVTIRAGEVMVVEAQNLADKECGKYNRYAVLRIRPTERTANYWVYDCVDR